VYKNSRRTEDRFPTDGPARMRILGQRRRVLTVRVCNVSKSGLRIQLGTKVKEGTRVHIFINDSRISAEARNCSKMDFDLYEAGFKISDVLWPAVETSHITESLATALGRGRRVSSANLSNSNLEYINGNGKIIGEEIETLHCSYQMVVQHELEVGKQISAVIRPEGDPWLVGSLLGQRLLLELKDGRVWPFSFVKANGRALSWHLLHSQAA
jgi:hypothetical protein